MAFNGYMSINGKRQGLISSGCNTQASVGNRCQVAHQDEIMAMSFSHDISNPDNTQRA